MQTTVHSKFSRLFGAVCLFLAASSLGVAKEPGRWATLEAIHHLENPRNSSKPGPKGELGPYQFRRSTWRMHTKEPFTRALDRAVADRVAVRHYEWIKKQLTAAGKPVTAYNVALAWNAGVGAVISNKAPRVARDYAERANNLALTFDRSAALAAAR